LPFLCPTQPRAPTFVSLRIDHNRYKAGIEPLPNKAPLDRHGKMSIRPILSRHQSSSSPLPAPVSPDSNLTPSPSLQPTIPPLPRSIFGSANVSTAPLLQSSRSPSRVSIQIVDPETPGIEHRSSMINSQISSSGSRGGSGGTAGISSPGALSGAGATAGLTSALSIGMPRTRTNSSTGEGRYRRKVGFEAFAAGPDALFAYTCAVSVRLPGLHRGLEDERNPRGRKRAIVGRQ